MKKIVTLCLALLMTFSLCAPFSVSAECETVVFPTAGATTIEFEKYIAEFKSDATTDKDGRLTSEYIPQLATARNANYLPLEETEQYSGRQGVFRIISSLSFNKLGVYIPVKFPAAGTYKLELIANKTGIENAIHNIVIDDQKITFDTTAGANYLIFGKTIDMCRYNAEITVSEPGETEIFYYTEKRNTFLVLDCLTITPLKLEFPPAPVEISDARKTTIEFENYYKEFKISEKTSESGRFKTKFAPQYATEKNENYLPKNETDLYSGKEGIYAPINNLKAKLGVYIPVAFKAPGTYQVELIANKTGKYDAIHNVVFNGKKTTFKSASDSNLVIDGKTVDMCRYTMDITIETPGETEFFYYTEKASSRMVLDCINITPVDVEISLDCSEWATEYIMQAKKEGFLENISDASYKEPITREEFCEILFNMHEATQNTESLNVDIETIFDDCKNEKVAALYLEGIINGKGDKIFAPQDFLTREEAATILVRYINKFIPVPVTEMFFDYDDLNNVSAWASDSVQVISNLGIMNGVGENQFAPKNTYTKEQAIATIIRVYHLNK